MTTRNDIAFNFDLDRWLAEAEQVLLVDPAAFARSLTPQQTVIAGRVLPNLAGFSRAAGQEANLILQRPE